ncbi:putative nuclease HARBI1 [Amphibalanus amphitrite]|uniref:Putative nuclease HARBI1 n=2 Tax=Amphibalanus amphitrite TaxID=1232801 RepID=A0A6A4VE13_AMPAM|nr:putative nuclease HARBI1 [Amphibalanus amphitrite]
MSDAEFRENFRVKRSTLACLVEILGERDGTFQSHCPINSYMSRERQLLLALFYLGSTVSFRKISEQFNMTMSSAFDFIDEVVEQLANLKEIFIRMPSTHQMQGTVDGFYEVSGVQGVLGVVNDCHIPIRKPMHDPETFSNWRGFFSVHLMTVSDAYDRLTDVCVGWPGGMHEAEVLDSGPLSAQLSRDDMRENFVPGDCFLVGAETLPLRPWLMTPYRANRLPPSDARKYYYNTKMEQTAEVGRRAVGVMRARFRRLSFVDTKSVKKAVMLTCASCVLHNMCLTLEDRWGEELVEEDEVEGVKRAEGPPGPGGNLAPAGAHRRRNRLVEELWSQRSRRT